MDLNHWPLPYQVGSLHATFSITAAEVSSSVHHYPGGSASDGSQIGSRRADLIGPQWPKVMVGPKCALGLLGPASVRTRRRAPRLLDRIRRAP